MTLVYLLSGHSWAVLLVILYKCGGHTDSSQDYVKPKCHSRFKSVCSLTKHETKDKKGRVVKNNPRICPRGDGGGESLLCFIHTKYANCLTRPNKKENIRRRVRTLKRRLQERKEQRMQTDHKYSCNFLRSEWRRRHLFTYVLYCSRF